MLNLMMVDLVFPVYKDLKSLNSAVNAKIKCIIFPGKFHLNKNFKNAYKKISKLNKNIILK